jgi:hypothetical protein
LCGGKGGGRANESGDDCGLHGVGVEGRLQNEIMVVEKATIFTLTDDGVVG